MKGKLVVFSDFDGTIARRDVGNRLFSRFTGGRSADLVPAWKAGEITSREILQQEAAMFEGTEEQVYTFLDTFDLSDGFVELESLCRADGVPLIILSDGLTLYIRHILARHGVTDIEIHANLGHLRDGQISVEFPYPLGACGRCGNCKGDRIAEYRRSHPEKIHAVFIGDGLSDTCAIKQTDTLFAKKDLKQYCIENKIRYHGYNTFRDVTAHLLGLGWLKSQKNQTFRTEE